MRAASRPSAWRGAASRIQGTPLRRLDDGRTVRDDRDRAPRDRVGRVLEPVGLRAADRDEEIAGHDPA
jgi:hypothetical protein